MQLSSLTCIEFTDKSFYIKNGIILLPIFYNNLKGMCIKSRSSLVNKILHANVKNYAKFSNGGIGRPC